MQDQEHPPPPQESHIIVVGAGIVGISCALYLQKSGFKVTLIDRNGAGNGASYGNAGAIHPGAFVPVNSPFIPRRLLSLLFSGGSPLSINWAYLPHMIGWLRKFLRHCTESEVRRIAAALETLLSRNIDYAMPLFKESGADRLIRPGGYLHLYERHKDMRRLSLELSLYKKLGAVEEIDSEEIRRLEPDLAPIFVKALYFSNALHYLSPAEVCRRMAQHFAAQGGNFRIEHVRSLSRCPDGRVRVVANHEILCDQLVLSAGAHSMRLAADIIEKLPLETERGYHIVFGGNGDIINRTCSSATAGFAMTPMNDGLRCAGMVELAGLDKRPNPACHAYLERTARRFLPGLTGRATTSWMGFRPSMPDALPVIGRSQRTSQIILAFGHQHIGMSCGCVTGKIVADIAVGSKPIIDITPFSPARFQDR